MVMISSPPPNMSKFEKEIKKLGSFAVPSERELSVMELLHEDYRRTGENKGIHATEVFRTLNIPDGQDVSTLNDSRYLDKSLDGTHETFKLSTDGIRYMDYFFSLIRRQYENLAGAVKNGEMVNRDKASRARQWAKEKMQGKEGESSLWHEERPEEIVKIAPEFYGVGVNLRALWRKISKFFK
jgi:hypothetical protein